MEDCIIHVVWQQDAAGNIYAQAFYLRPTTTQTLRAALRGNWGRERCLINTNKLQQGNLFYSDRRTTLSYASQQAGF